METIEKDYTRSIEAREAKRKYDKAWRAANKEKIKKYNHDYWERKAKRNKQNNPEDSENERS